MLLLELLEATGNAIEVVKRITFDDIIGKNTRFMFNPARKLFILGRGTTNGSHAEEFHDSGAPGKFDEWLPRGWIGQGRGARYGVIHFAPPMRDLNDPSTFNAAFTCLELFRKAGFPDKCIVRGFGSEWEQPLGAALAGVR